MAGKKSKSASAVAHAKKMAEAAKAAFDTFDAAVAAMEQAVPDDDITHVTILLDRSGSMAAIQDDVIGGVNSYLDGLAEDSNAYAVTMILFDTRDPHELLCTGADPRMAPRLNHSNFQPRGGTPLLDAVGRAIAKLRNVARATDKAIFVVYTDGEENSSREFDRACISKMVAGCDEAGWAFVFMGAGIDAFKEARDLGFSVRNTVSVGVTRQSVGTSYDKLFSKTTGYAATGNAGVVGFTSQDRADMADDKKT